MFSRYDTRGYDKYVYASYFLRPVTVVCMVVTFIRSNGVVESEVSNVDETVVSPSVHQRSQPKRRRRRQVRKDGAAAGRL